MYPHDPTGPSLDRAGDYDPDWDLPPEETPPDWQTRTLDVLAMLAWIAGVLMILGMLILAIFSPASAEAHVPGADLGTSQGAWLTDPYSPIPAQTLEAALDAVSKTHPAEILETLETLRPSLYAAAMGSIENWDRTSGFVKNNFFDDACWSVQETQQRLWYELAQFYNDPPRDSIKRRLKKTLRDLIAAERMYRWCWDGFLKQEGDLR